MIRRSLFGVGGSKCSGKSTLARLIAEAMDNPAMITSLDLETAIDRYQAAAKPGSYLRERIKDERSKRKPGQAYSGIAAVYPLADYLRTSVTGCAIVADFPQARTQAVLWEDIPYRTSSSRPEIRFICIHVPSYGTDENKAQLVDYFRDRTLQLRHADSPEELAQNVRSAIIFLGFDKSTTDDALANTGSRSFLKSVYAVFGAEPPVPSLPPNGQRIERSIVIGSDLAALSSPIPFGHKIEKAFTVNGGMIMP